MAGDRKQRARGKKNTSKKLRKRLRQAHEVGHVLQIFVTVFDFRTTIYDHHLVCAAANAVSHRVTIAQIPLSGR